MNTLILGATKGLGKAIAAECANMNWRTIEVGSSIQDAEESARTRLRCDLSSPASVKELVKRLSTRPLDCVFWVAGRLIKGDFSAQPEAEILQTIDVNFRNAIPIIKHAWNRMRTNPAPSKIVVIASSSGVKARCDEAIYVSTKFAQVGFTRSLGLENQNPNLKISLILPGGMKTRFYERIPDHNLDSFLEPNKVARKIMTFILEQQDTYAELPIPRGSLS